MKKITVVEEGYDIDYDMLTKTEYVIGEADEIKAVYKSLRRNGWWHDIFPVFLDFPTFVVGREYGISVSYYDNYVEYSVIGGNAIKSLRDDGLI